MPFLPQADLMTRRNVADKAKIATLITQNKLTQEQTSQLTGISRSRISEIMSEVKTNADVLLLKDNKAEILEGIQAKLINLADDDLLKTMLSKRGMTDVAILEDKIRLIRGQATSISDIQVRGLIAMIQAAPVDNPTCQPNSDVIDVD
jgi:transcriptional regulator with XRE-family HTH domain